MISAQRQYATCPDGNIKFFDSISKSRDITNNSLIKHNFLYLTTKAVMIFFSSLSSIYALALTLALN